MGHRLGSLYISLSMFFQLVLLFNEAGASGRKCSHIYKGFAECLLKLGDSLAKTIEGESEEVKELDTVCRLLEDLQNNLSDPIRALGQALPSRTLSNMMLESPFHLLNCVNFDLWPTLKWRGNTGSWDDFHACADSVLEGCPEDAASIWESLRKESRKLQFQGNLHELCSLRVRPSGTMGNSDGRESNSQSLTGSAGSLWSGFATPVLSIAVLVANL